MDDDSQELVRLAAEGGVEAFLRTVAAPLVELGGWSADVIRRHRFRSAVRTAALAKEWLEEAGIEPHAVSLKVLVPLLEYASLEPDPDEAQSPEEAHAMHERWAALLANASAATEGAEVLPSFPRVLAELMPIEARMLEMLAEADWPSRRNVWAFAEPLGYDRWDPASGRAYMVHVDNLERLNLCTISRPDLQLQELTKKLEDERRAQARTWPPPRRLARLSTDAEMAISALGRAFVAACTPPTGAQENT
jgi:hypothetical protein